jgi:hypothetical protein
MVKEKKGRPRIPGKVLIRKLDIIDDIKEPTDHKKFKNIDSYGVHNE